MERNMEVDVLRKLKRRRRQRAWKRVVIAMMCLVVFCTTYALILPAITQESDTFCGIEEHKHTSACYPQQERLICEFAEIEVHKHTEDCHPVTEEMPSCGLEEIEAHTHSDACMSPDGKQLCCSLEEREGHAHSEACEPVTEQIVSCMKAETQGHSHSDACPRIEEKMLGCNLAEDETHIHTDECFTIVTTGFGCGMEEVEAHFHSEECYTVTTTYGCGLEEVEAHAHGDACFTVSYICGLEETEGHTHADTCYRTVYDCGQDALVHEHSEDCYESAPALICTLEENGEHSHDANCFAGSAVCGLEEHEHELECYSDPTADVEGPAYWESTLPGSLSGIYAEDLLAVAASQLGYTESSRNYYVDELNEIKGYTRYGAWYGLPYGDWCAMFVSFCLNYANVDAVPQDCSCADWIVKLQEAGMYAPASGYTPKSGDIIFFDWNADGSSDHVGIVSQYFPAEENDTARLQCIEGNCNNTVCCTNYNQADPTILGYGILPDNRPVEPEEPEEEIPQPEATIGPRDTNAWAVLVGAENQPEEESASTPGLFRLAASPWAMPRAAGSLELDEFINAVVMYDSDGNVIPSGSIVTEGDMIEFRIEYTVTGQQLGTMSEDGKTMTFIADTLTYDLPDIFSVIAGDSGNILNSVGQTVGTYVIDAATGTIIMNFTSDYVEQNAKGIQIHGFISFFSSVRKITDKESENQDYAFTDDIKLGIIVEEFIEAVGDLTIEKNKIGVDGEKLTFEVIVSTEEGTKGPVTVQDQMSPGLTIDRLISVKNANGSNVNYIRFTPSADEKSFELVLPEMSPGETYIVRYSCDADINDLGSDMTVRNSATVSGKDSQDKDLKGRDSVTHTFDVLKKTGKANENGSITWTITINQAKADISGWTLEDYLGNGENRKDFTGPVTIVGSNGNVVARNVSLPYKFPNGSNDTYTITYTTTHEFADGDKIYNTAILSDNDTDISVESDVDVIGNPFTKTGVAGEPFMIDGTYVLPITWTVTIDTTNSAIPGGSWLIDKMYGWPSDDMFMTRDQVIAANNSIDLAVKEVTGQELLWFSAHEYYPGSDREGTPYGYYDLISDTCKDLLFERFSAQLGDLGIPKGEFLTFSYEAYGIFPNNMVSNTSFVNRFNLNEQYEVEARVNYTGGKIGLKKMNLAMPIDPDNLTGSDWSFGGNEGYADYEDLKKAYIGWAIELSVPPDYSGDGDILLVEDLPEGINVKRMDFNFLSGFPVRERLTKENIKPGDSFSWDFNLMNEYGYETDQKSSIKVEMTDEGDLEITVPEIVVREMARQAMKDNKDEWWAYLYIYAQIDEVFDWPKSDEGSNVYFNTFENTCSIYGSDGDRIDKATTKHHINKDESDSIVRKKATADGNNIVSYSVILNAYGRDLIENADMLNIHDEMTYTSPDGTPVKLRLVPGSVKLYEVDMNIDGTYTKLGELTANYSYAESSVAGNGSTVWTNTIDLQVPDGKALLLEYRYLASGAIGGHHEIFNTCKITGVGEGSIDGNHRLDIEIKKASAQADVEGVTICKVDSNSDGIFLEKARFNVYIWNPAQKEYIIVHHPNNGGTDFETDANGMIVLDNTTMNQFAYNTAYYIVEVESPEGYYLSPEKYYFQIYNSDLVKYPSCLPDKFNGSKLTSGDIIYRKNVSSYTEITVNKFWQDYNGNAITVSGEQVNSVTLELWQMLRGNPDSAVKYGTYTMTPDKDGNWSLTIKKLPEASERPDGTKGTDYLYFVKEVAVNGYSLESSENNNGIPAGVIELTNRKLEGYVLPESGGPGTLLYTMAGLLLTLTSAAYLMYRNKPRRREEQ